jgi:hypothetical protein
LPVVVAAVMTSVVVAAVVALLNSQVCQLEVQLQSA